MPAGILVKTPNGDIQIDGESPAITLYKKTTYTTDKLEYVCGSSKSLIAVCLDDYTSNRLRFDLVDNLPIGDIRKYSIECMNVDHWPTIGTFTVYEFMSVSGFPAGVDLFKYGLEIYDGNGKVIFNSNYPTIRPIGYIQRANGSPYDLPLRNPSEQYSSPLRGSATNKKIAIVVSQLGYQSRRFSNGGTSLNYAIAGFYIDAANNSLNLDYKWIRVANMSGLTQTAAVGDPFSVGMAIDVTNY